MNQREKGTEMERIAAGWLIRQGCELIGHQYRTPYGELDLIYRDGDELVFGEVKYRSGTGFGMPAESVRTSKQQHLRKAALLYAEHSGQADSPMRFDVIEILDRDGRRWIRQIKNAF
ncbi:MAG: YraN family protein [Firmicutes bacterium]|nr:YraN family protein [Bacillota bacterium]